MFGSVANGALWGIFSSQLFSPYKRTPYQPTSQAVGNQINLVIQLQKNFKRQLIIKERA
jgi:hypothetical protein